MDSIFFQVLKIDESDEIAIDEDSTILKVQSWKDTLSRINQQEEFHREGAERYGKEEWGWDYEKDKPLLDEWKTDEETGKTVEDVGSRLSPSQLETRAKHRKTVKLREEFEDDKLDSFDVPIGEAPQYGPKKKPWDGKSPEKTENLASGTWGLTGLGEGKSTEEEVVPIIDLSKLPLGNIENMLDNDQHKNLTNKEITDELEGLNEKITNWTKGQSPREKKILDELHNRASKLRPVIEAQDADSKRTFPSTPTLEDAKESLGARKTKAQYEKELERLQAQHKVNVEVHTKAKRELRELEQKISNIEKTSERRRRNSRRAKRMYDRKASLEHSLDIRRLYLSMKMTQVNEIAITESQKISSDTKIPISLADFIGASQPSMNTVIRWFVDLFEAHKQYLPMSPDYEEELMKERPFKGEGEKARDAHILFLTKKLKELVDTIAVNSNKVIGIIKNDIAQKRIQLKESQEEISAGITMSPEFEEQFIDNTEKKIKKEIETLQKTREYLIKTKKDVKIMERETIEQWKDFQFDISIEVSRQTNASLIFKMINDKVGKQSIHTSFQELENRNYFAKENLFKLAQIFKHLKAGEIEKAKLLPKKYQMPQMTQLVDVFRKKHGGQYGWKVFLEILDERRITFPDPDSIKDATRKVIERHEGFVEHQAQLEAIENIFNTPNISDDLGFLSKPSYVQQMLDLAEMNFKNTLDDIADTKEGETAETLKLRKADAIAKLGKLSYVAKFLNDMSKDTDFLNDVGGRLIVPTDALSEVGITYGGLEDKYGKGEDAILGQAVQEKIIKIIKGTAEIKTTKPEVSEYEPPVLQEGDTEALYQEYLEDIRSGKIKFKDEDGNEHTGEKGVELAQAWKEKQRATVAESAKERDERYKQVQEERRKKEEQAEKQKQENHERYLKNMERERKQKKLRWVKTQKNPETNENFKSLKEYEDWENKE